MHVTAETASQLLGSLTPGTHMVPTAVVVALRTASGGENASRLLRMQREGIEGPLVVHQSITGCSLYDPDDAVGSAWALGFIEVPVEIVPDEARTAATWQSDFDAHVIVEYDDEQQTEYGAQQAWLDAVPGFYVKIERGLVDEDGARISKLEPLVNESDDESLRPPAVRNDYEHLMHFQWAKAAAFSADDVGDDEHPEGWDDLEECTHSGLIVKSRESNRVLLIQRTPDANDDADTYGRWEFPGGSIDEGEDPFESAVREFEEETGLKLPDECKLVGLQHQGNYVAFQILVTHEAWVHEATFDPFETMGIGWFDTEELEATENLLRKVVYDHDWDDIREASKTALRTSRMGPLYHGTTDANAGRILSEGFVPNTDRKGTIYLTEDPDLAMSYAEAVCTKPEGGEPVVLKVDYIEGVSAMEVGYMDFDMARDAGADYSPMYDEVVVLNPGIIHGVSLYSVRTAGLLKPLADSLGFKWECPHCGSQSLEIIDPGDDGIYCHDCEGWCMGQDGPDVVMSVQTYEELRGLPPVDAAAGVVYTCSLCMEEIEDGSERWDITHGGKGYVSEHMHADCGDSYTQEERDNLGQTWVRVGSVVAHFASTQESDEILWT